MKIRILPVVGLIALAAATAVATRSVVAAGRQARRPQAKVVPRLAPKVIVLGGPTVAIDRATGGVGRLEVAASAEVWHPVRDQVVAWHLKVFRRVGSRPELAWHQSYDAQPLLVPLGATKRPTFAEALVMPPGDYTVQVGLDELSTDAAGRRLTRIIVSDVARVTVR